jgi:hypothetical protein
MGEPLQNSFPMPKTFSLLAANHSFTLILYRSRQGRRHANRKSGKRHFGQPRA